MGDRPSSFARSRSALARQQPQEQLFDEVLLPALSYARRDRELGRLTEDGEQFFFRATREILGELNPDRVG